MACLVVGVAGCVLISVLSLLVHDAGRGASQLVRARIEWPELEPLTVSDLPFQPGERLHYRLGWNGIPCADLSISLNCPGGLRRGVWRIEYEGSTTAGLDRFWSYRMKGWSLVDRCSLRTLRGRRESREEGETKRYRVSFQRATGIATTVTEELPDGDRGVERLRFVHGLDLPSAFFLIRTLDLEAGEKEFLEVVHEDQVYALEVLAGAEEPVESAIGDISARRVEIRVHALAGDEEEREEEESKYRSLTLWLSDERRLPVKMESQMRVGRVYGQLVEVGR